MIPITDKPTSVDSSHASDVLALCNGLLGEAELQRRLTGLAADRPAGPAQSVAEACEHGAYWSAVNQLSRELDGLWSSAEVDQLCATFNAGRAFDGDTSITGLRAAVGFVAGRGGRGRRGRPLNPSTIKLAARSLALRLTGLNVTEADRRAADEKQHEPQTVAIYRMRLRKRLDG